MDSLRQIGTGILIALISIAILLGGYSLASTEGRSANPILAATQAEAENPSAYQPLPTFTEISQEATASSVVLSEAVSGTATPIPAGSDTPVPSQTSCPPPGGWVAVIVKPLDTVASLARYYQMSQDELARGNCLSNYQVEVGATLYVRPLLVSSTQVIALPACGAPAGWVDYYVARGDTLFNLGIRYRVSVTELQKANCLGSSTNIQVGQKLKVPYVLATTEPITTPTLEIPTSIPPTDEPTIAPTPVTVEPSPLPPTEVTPPTETPSSTPIAAPNTITPDPTPG